MNKNGGLYTSGHYYSMERKLEVMSTYLGLWEASFPKKPSISKLAKEAQVGWAFAKQIVEEYEKQGLPRDPKEIKNNSIHKMGNSHALDVTEEIFDK